LESFFVLKIDGRVLPVLLTKDMRALGLLVAALAACGLLLPNFGGCGFMVDLELAAPGILLVPNFEGRGLPVDPRTIPSM
jgi:hypothetical protein